MNDSRLGITRENLLLIVPPALTQDPSMMALASSDAEALAARLAEIDRVRIISNIDGLDEAVLDILAYDFKVDWYDPEYSLEEKRRTLKDNWLVHKHLGTKYAVRTALNAVYPGAIVQEWFEYGGNPYCFRVILPASEELTVEKQKRVLSWIPYYKNLRSHLEKITALVEAAACVYMVFCAHRFDFRTQPSIFGLQTVRLDGVHFLDGSWLLSTEWARGAKFPIAALHYGRGYQVLLQGTASIRGCTPCMPDIKTGDKMRAWQDGGGSQSYRAALYCGKELHPLLCEGMSIGGRSFYMPGIKTADKLKTRKENGVSQSYRAVISAGVEAGGTVSARLMTDSMWTLNGARSLDGSRKLNAELGSSKL